MCMEARTRIFLVKLIDKDYYGQLFFSQFPVDFLKLRSELMNSQNRLLLRIILMLVVIQIGGRLNYEHLTIFSI